MPEFNDVAEESMQERFGNMWESHQELLRDEVFEALDEHISTIEGYNRGHTSSADMVSRDGPTSSRIRLTIQNSASKRVICHELGHALIDSQGIDATQEATDRACNKSNYSRWPQFSFGKKDSPCERFMLRRYGDLPDLTRTELTEDDLEYIEGRSDIFYIDDRSMSWFEPFGYKYASDRREYKRYEDPFLREAGELVGVRVTGINGGGPTNLTPGASEHKDVYIVDRYELTPGLEASITDAEEESWSDPIDELVYYVNRYWYEAVTMVRKRGETRELGKKKAPKGASSSYYLMNANEYFAELHALMMRHEQGADWSGQHVDRLREHCPGLVEAYRDAIFSH